MSFFIAILDFIMIIYVFFSGIIATLIYFGIPNQNYVNKTINALINPSNIYHKMWPFATLCFFGITLLSVFFRRKRSLSSNDILIKSKDGNIVQISNKAIKNFIEKIINSIDGVHSSTIKVLTNNTKSKIIIKIVLVLYEGTSYPEINNQIIDLVKSKLDQKMGIKKINPISFALDKYVPYENAPSIIEEEMAITE